MKQLLSLLLCASLALSLCACGASSSSADEEEISGLKDRIGELEDTITSLQERIDELEDEAEASAGERADEPNPADAVEAAADDRITAAVTAARACMDTAELRELNLPDPPVADVMEYTCAERSLHVLMVFLDADLETADLYGTCALIDLNSGDTLTSDNADLTAADPDGDHTAVLTYLYSALAQQHASGSLEILFSETETIVLLSDDDLSTINEQLGLS